MFHSLQQGGAGVTAAEPVPAAENGAALQPPPPGPSPQHISLPPYMAGIPLPGSQGAQTIHINNFTANLNFPPAPVTTAVSSQSGKHIKALVGWLCNIALYCLYYVLVPCSPGSIGCLSEADMICTLVLIFNFPVWGLSRRLVPAAGWLAASALLASYWSSPRLQCFV